MRMFSFDKISWNSILNNLIVVFFVENFLIHHYSSLKYDCYFPRNKNSFHIDWGVKTTVFKDNLIMTGIVNFEISASDEQT